MGHPTFRGAKQHHQSYQDLIEQASAKSKPIEQVKSERRTEETNQPIGFPGDTDLEDEFNSLPLGDTAWFLQEDR